jgi:hypothetical protein
VQNYRSAVLFGTTALVTDDKEKVEALTLITDHQFHARDGTKGPRWDQSVPPTEAEIKSTRVVRFEIDMASAKVREGGPSDDKGDEAKFSSTYWTGQIVREDRYTKLVPSSYNQASVPDYIQAMVD